MKTFEAYVRIQSSGYIVKTVVQAENSQAAYFLLQGQYGHSGKLQAVKGVDQDMMDRIKFLAGITK